MKVAIFTDTFLPQRNGVTTVIHEQIKQLTKKGIEVVVFAPGKETHMEFCEGARVYKISGLSTKYYPEYVLAKPKNVVRIQTLIEMENPDIYHIHTPFVLGIFGLYFAKKYKKPIVGTFHTLISEYMGHLTYGASEKIINIILKKPTWAYLKAFYSRCNKTIALGKQISNLLNENNINNTVIIPNGIDVKKLRKEKIKDMRRKYGIPKDKIIFFYLGRVSLDKKILLLIKAFIKANDKDKFYLMIGGTGPQIKKYEDMIRARNIKGVKFLGFVPDKELQSHFATADVFVSASDTEICPVSFLEAGINGNAIIGSNKMGSKDLIKNGINGFTFKNGDVDDLIRKIKKVGNDKKLINKMKKNSKKIVEDYDTKVITEKTIKLYESLLKKK